MALTENDVVAACATYLRSTGYEINSACSTADRGVDLVATNRTTGSRLFVEAKGGTSSKAHTRRYGRPFDLRQARSHVSRALFEVARLASEPGAKDVAIALPTDAHHRRLVNQILPVLQRIPASVLWVSDDLSVEWWPSR